MKHRNAAVALLLFAVACADADTAGRDAGPPTADASSTADGATATGDAATDAAVTDTVCPAHPGGLACLFSLHDEVAAGCDPERLDDLRDSLATRAGRLPVWFDGRALFVTDAGAAIAGDFNGWDPEQVGTLPLCESELFTAMLTIPSGNHEYKLVRDGSWFLDPGNWAFAYDDFAGNPDGKNSVLATYDSGLGHLVSPGDWLCSDALDDCRPLTVYVPPGYGDPANAMRRYPTVFVHDGQNVFDDGGCCFGGTGWELNRTLDAEIAAGEVAPVLIAGFDHAGEQRLAEYGGDRIDDFMAFQVETVQATTAALFRVDADRVYTAGSSLGGYVSLRLAHAYPQVYAGAASLSGSFFVDEGGAGDMRAIVAAAGPLPLSIYLDHGGTAEDGADNHGSNLALRDAMIAAGYVSEDSPACEAGPGRLCYFHAVGAAHDEAAWRDRSWRFLRFLVPGSP